LLLFIAIIIMTPSSLCLLFWLGWVGLSSCQPEQQATSQPDQQQDIAQIKAISEARAKAFVQGNAAGIAQHFSEDAVLMVPDAPARNGRKAVEAYYQAIFDQYSTQLTSGYEQVQVEGNLAYGRGFARLILTPKQGGPTIRSTAKYLNILERQADGTWKTTHDIWNSNEKAPSSQ
jgi:uncharacterized protein (TIGR02246 family)